MSAIRYKATIASGPHKLREVLVSAKKLEKDHAVKLVGYGDSVWKIRDIEQAADQKPQIGDALVT